MLRGGAVRSAHRLHGPEDAGSNPAPASISDVETKKLSCPEGGKAASLRASITEKRMNDGKLGHLGLFLDPSAQPPKLHPPTQPQLRCPECGSSKLYKDGIRYTQEGSVQRLLCRGCGYRFSEKEPGGSSRPLQESLNWHLKAGSNISPGRQICAALMIGGAKNLGSTTEIKTVAGDRRKLDKAAAKGVLLQYTLYLQKEGYGENCRYVSCIRMLLNSDCNVYNPEDVKETIAKKKWKDGTKMQACYAYDALAKMLGLSWVMPTYRQEEYIFFLPEENELDVLISAARSRRMTAYLQTLKETFADPSEALGLRWIDVDANRNVITINKPVKNHRPRELEVNSRLIGMLNALPKTSDLIFQTCYRNMQSSFVKLRKRVASRLQNPRILKISFVSFRHWGGTQLAWLSNGNVLFVKDKLGHRKVENTMKYIARIDWKLNQDFEVVTATTDEEIKKYGEAGYQKYDERTLGATHISYYRRPKRFGSVKV